jgi:hypothetical protein
MIKKLIKLADSLDKLNLYKEVNIIDVLIKKIAQASDEYDFPLEELNQSQLEAFHSKFEPDIDHDVLRNAFAKIFNKYIDYHNKYVKEHMGEPEEEFDKENTIIYERINPDDVEFEWTNKDESSFKSLFPQPYRWNVKNKSTGSIKEFDAWIEEEGAYPEYAIERVMGRDNDADKTPKEFIIYWEI